MNFFMQLTLFLFVFKKDLFAYFTLFVSASILIYIYELLNIEYVLFMPVVTLWVLKIK